MNFLEKHKFFRTCFFLFCVFFCVSGYGVNRLRIKGSTSPLVVSSAVAGFNPSNATDSSTTYTIRTDRSSSKITARIDSLLPNNNELSILLEPPTTGTSVGKIILSTTDQTVVSDISITKKTQRNLQITYELESNISEKGASSMPSNQSVVTLTLSAT